MNRVIVKALTAASFLVVLLLGASAHVRAGEARRVHFDIPAQPLATALLQFSEQAKVQITAPSQLVGDRRTDGIKGEYGAAQALQQVLQGSGLSFEFINEGAVAIRVPDKVKEVANERQDASRSEGGMRLAQGETQSGMQKVAGTENQSSSGAQDSSDPGKKGEIGEIIVTAQKREERLQDVPISVTAIAKKQLEEVGAVDVKDVFRTVPGLSLNSVERGESRYAIRGISTDAVTPTTGVYLDGIPMNRRLGYYGSFDAIFFDIERLEVLKGPQGTLYGGSAMGGAIKYVSALPDLSKFTGDTSAGVATTRGGDLSYRAEGVINIPVIPDVLAVRGGVYYLREGGYTDNVASGDIESTAFSSTPFPNYTPRIRPSLSTVSEDDHNFSDTYVGRLSLLWQPNETWSIKPSLIYQDTEKSDSSMIFTNQGGSSSSWRFSGLKTISRDIITSLDITKALRGVELASLTAYTDRTFKKAIDFTYHFFYPNNNTFGFTHDSSKTFSQELRLSSDSTNGSALRWLVGFFYAEQTSDLASSVYAEGLFPPSGLAYINSSVFKEEENAAFGEATYGITDALDVTAGVRFSRFKQGLNGALDGPLAGGATSPSLSAAESTVNPKFGLSYKAGNDNLLYFSAAKGFRSGGAVGGPPTYEICAEELALLGFDHVPRGYDSDTIWSYEIGSKNTFGDGRTLVNASVFYTDWDDIQQSVALPNCGFGFLTNAGAARVQGAEVASQWVATENFEIGANATFMDAEITKAAYGSPAEEGDEVLYTPQWMANIYGLYSVPVTAKWDLTVRADYQYLGKQRTRFVDTQRVTYSDGTVGFVPYAALYQESYDVLNASVFLKSNSTRVRLYLDNALDVRPLLDPAQGGPYSSARAFRPRTIGLEVRWSSH